MFTNSDNFPLMLSICRSHINWEPCNSFDLFRQIIFWKTERILPAFKIRQVYPFKRLICNWLIVNCSHFQQHTMKLLVTLLCLYLFLSGTNAHSWVQCADYTVDNGTLIICLLFVLTFFKRPLGMLAIVEDGLVDMGA
jgi:hypothetical protein